MDEGVEEDSAGVLTATLMRATMRRTSITGRESSHGRLLPIKKYMLDFNPFTPLLVLSLDFSQGILIRERRYEGDFLCGKFSGQGSLDCGVNQEKYTGAFKNGLYAGQGVLTTKEGDVYEGNFERGNARGNVSIRYKGGDYYQGGISQGKYCGRGKIVYASEQGNYDGDWK